MKGLYVYLVNGNGFITKGNEQIVEYCIEKERIIVHLVFPNLTTLILPSVCFPSPTYQ